MRFDGLITPQITILSASDAVTTARIEGPDQFRAEDHLTSLGWTRVHSESIGEADAQLFVLVRAEQVDAQQRVDLAAHITALKAELAALQAKLSAVPAAPTSTLWTGDVIVVPEDNSGPACFSPFDDDEEDTFADM